MEAAENATAEDLFDQSMADMGHGEDTDVPAEDLVAAQGSNQMSEDDVNQLLAGEEVPASDADEDVEGEEDVEAEVADESEEPESEEEAPEEEAELSPKANERFQALANERNELRAQAEAQAQQLQQMQQYLQQMQAQQQQQQQTRQEQLAEQQLRMMQQQAAAEEKRRHQEWLDNLSVADKWKYETEQKALSRAEQMLAERLRPYEQKFAQMEQEKRAAQEQAQRQATLNQFYAQTKSAMEPLAQSFGDKAPEGLDDVVLAWSAAYGITPDEATKRLQGVMDSYAEAKIRGKVRPTAKAEKRAPGAPIVPKSNKASGDDGKLSWPTMSQLEKAGYDDHLDWLEAGRPSLI